MPMNEQATKTDGTLADKQAMQLLQQAIDACNDNPTAQVAREMMPLADKACQMAVGAYARARCMENRRLMQEIIDNEPPAEVAAEARQVEQALNDFVRQPDEIRFARQLVEQTRPLLDTIAQRIGREHPYYLRLSTRVVDDAINNMSAEINLRMQDIDNQQGRLRAKLTVTQAMALFRAMDDMDMIPQFKSGRYSENRITLSTAYNKIMHNTDSGGRGSWHWAMQLLGWIVIIGIILIVKWACSR